MTDSRTVGPSDGKATAACLLAALAVLSVGPTVRPSHAQDTLPIGYGTLKRDDIVVRFATDQLEIQILPLAEYVIRLLAPDTYQGLANDSWTGVLPTLDRERARVMARASLQPKP